ncbi:hypothetical protein [Brucella gallinifaecis]|uniref:hypothetical protein n=1 Tax=Brucella gallinifaecis TaxID=215590 RepID=UPI002360417C|nr:hypothetical protein [Brucella gallinifaecis]
MEKTYRLETQDASLTVKVQGLKSKYPTLKINYVTDFGIKCSSIVDLEQTGLLADEYYPCDKLCDAIFGYCLGEYDEIDQIIEIEKILRSYVKEFWTNEWVKPDLSFVCHFTRRTHKHSSANSADQNIYRSKFKNWTLIDGALARTYSQEIVETGSTGQKTYKKLADIVIPDGAFIYLTNAEKVLSDYTANSAA